MKNLFVLITFIGLFFLVGRTIWSISEENFIKDQLRLRNGIVYLSEPKVCQFIKGFQNENN